MPCLDENVLSEHLARRLGSTESARVVAHLDECAVCADLMMALARVYPGEGSVYSSTVAAGAPPPKHEPHALVETPPQVIDRYVVLEPLGAGAMGVVFAAYDPKLDRKIAIKVLRKRPGEDEGTRGAQRRLMLEARTMARLSHPNVLAVHDVGSHEGHVFLVADLVDGGTLRTWLVREKRPVDEILLTMVQAARGLAAAHKAGLVHRDFKPDNVLVSRDGRVFVADFGLTCAAPTTRMERASAPAIAGTPAYMAPEVLRGADADARSDQYSFCVTLYAALFGSRPSDSEMSRTLATASASHVPEEVLAVLRRGLAADPEARFSSMDELSAQLSAFTTEAIVARAASSRSSVASPPSRPARRRAPLVLGAVLVLAAAAGFALHRRPAAAASVSPANANASANASANANAGSAAARETASNAPASSPVAVASAAKDDAAPKAPATPSRARAHAPRTTSRGNVTSDPSSPAPSADPLWRHY